MSAYSERLKHPMWQRKRLEILERDNFMCTQCDADDEQLHVHHLFYVKGREPWDYPSLSLTTLCHECHDSIHDESREADRFLIEQLRSFGIGNGELHDISCAFGLARGDDSRRMTIKEWGAISVALNALVRMVQAGAEIEPVANELSKQALKAEQDAT